MFHAECKDTVGKLTQMKNNDMADQSLPYL